MARCSVRTVERACEDEEMKAEKAPDPDSTGWRRGRYGHRRRLIWQIEAKSGTEWAQWYEPWKRMATA
jgi:hypothetical protein